MSTPGFTAEASLHKPSQSYHVAGRVYIAAPDGALRPQQGCTDRVIDNFFSCSGPRGHCILLLDLGLMMCSYLEGL
jgi:hypothetical protein